MSRLCIAIAPILCLCAAVIVNACSGGGSTPPPLYPLPGVGQWVTYGGQEPVVTANSFAFPSDGGKTVAGYFYTKLPAVPKQGQTLTLNYSVSGSNPVWQNSAAGGDTGAPTIHLFLWRKDDDISCVGAKSQYRMFADRTLLVLGDNQIMAAVLDPAVWTGCYAANSTAVQWTDLLNNLAGAGFTFGGQYFAGHGIYLSSGSATFKINSFTVQ